MTAPPPGTRSRGKGGAEPPVVLIVDDNARNRKLARDVLRTAGFRTLEAASGADGIALAAGELPDVVLLDLGLPDMDGTDVLREIRNNARTAHLPIVALSALRTDDDGEWLLAAGFAGYLEKPISVREFPDQVRMHCERA